MLPVMEGDIIKAGSSAIAAKEDAIARHCGVGSMTNRSIPAVGGDLNFFPVNLSNRCGVNCGAVKYLVGTSDKNNIKARLHGLVGYSVGLIFMTLLQEGISEGREFDSR